MIDTMSPKTVNATIETAVIRFTAISLKWMVD